jgi:ABC-2 type transport system permease protein
MLKALIKKELRQLISIYTVNRKTGKARSKGAAVLVAILFLFIGFSFGMLAYGMAQALAAGLIPSGRDAFYFAMMGLFTLAFGVIGNVFSTYAILYKAKDNDFLLSMPIPPAYILFSRMLVVLLMNLFFCLIVWLPAMIAYGQAAGFASPALIYQIILLFMITLLATVLSCFLGWIVALVTARVRNKSLAAVVFSLAFIGLYYFFYFKMDSILKTVIAKSDAIEQGMHGWGWPMWQLGLGASGKTVPTLIFSLIVLALFALTYYILSATLIRLLTASRTGKKAVYREKKEKQAGAPQALLRKEFSRFAASPTYILNCGIGLLILVAVAVAALIKADALRTVIASVLEPMGISPLVPIIVLVGVLMIASTVFITAPSVSLEGKSISVVQSMPVESSEVLKAKLRMHLILVLLPVGIAAAALCIVVKAPLKEALPTVACALAFVWLIAEFGLMMNLLKPNISWTNEAVPIKQDLPVMLTMFGGWLLAIILGGLCFLSSLFMKVAYALCVILVLELAASLLIHRWNMTRGAARFDRIV